MIYSCVLCNHSACGCHPDIGVGINCSIVIVAYSAPGVVVDYILVP